MEKGVAASAVVLRDSAKSKWIRLVASSLLIAGVLYSSGSRLGITVQSFVGNHTGTRFFRVDDSGASSPYGIFPQPSEPFRFQPCTKKTVPPPLHDENHEKTWAGLYDPDPSHWSWGNVSANGSATNDAALDEYAGQGIYMCGYLDVPLDYSNSSDPRSIRLAVTKYQVSGLARVDRTIETSSAGRKSARTIILEPGGPGGSGTSMVWRLGEKQTERLSLGGMDVLGWDPRGVNTSLPAAACYPWDGNRDRYSLLTTQHRRASSTSPLGQLELADTMNNATFAACKEVLGDLPRFVSTASVARDLEHIRNALGEPEVTGYFVSYGTGIGQTYANMFPHRIGRLILDGTEYVRDHRLLGGFGWTALDNATDAWRDGFLGECLAAGAERCALAQPLDANETVVTLSDLEARMSTLLSSLAARPMAGYTMTSGPSLVTYSAIVNAIYAALYNARTWPAMAQALFDLEQSNTTLAAKMLDRLEWEFDPPSPGPITMPSRASSDELGALVICADSYDAPQPPFDDNDQDQSGLSFWNSLWLNMTTKSWVSGDSRFYDVLPCRHYKRYFDSPSEVFRGDLNSTLAHPVLLIAETYDPATPLRNGRRLLGEMGKNARMVSTSVRNPDPISSELNLIFCGSSITAMDIVHVIRRAVPTALPGISSCTVPCPTRWKRTVSRMRNRIGIAIPMPQSLHNLIRMV